MSRRVPVRVAGEEVGSAILGDDNRAVSLLVYLANAEDLEGCTGLQLVILNGPKPCPECQQGKCGNCTGDSWDDELDEPGLCPCAATGHVAAGT
jgi:hypothetical protein